MPLRQLVGAAWGPDEQHVPPPKPPPAPDGLAGYQPHPGYAAGMGGLSIGSRASMPGRQPLIDLLTRYPTLNAPGMQNQSNRHMQAMAHRANTSFGRTSLLHDYLAGA